MQAEICAKRDIFAPERPLSPELLSHEFNPPRSIRHTQITTTAMPTSNRTHRAEFLQASATLERNNERHSKWSSEFTEQPASGTLLVTVNACNEAGQGVSSETSTIELGPPPP